MQPLFMSPTPRQLEDEKGQMLFFTSGIQKKCEQRKKYHCGYSEK